MSIEKRQGDQRQDHVKGREAYVVFTDDRAKGEKSDPRDIWTELNQGRLPPETWSTANESGWVDELSTTTSLQRCFDSQWEAQCEYWGLAPDELSDMQRGKYVRSMSLALIEEVGEALQEIAHKPWASDKSYFNKDAYKHELMDVFYFFLNLWLVTGSDAKEFTAIFDEVAEKNRLRRAGDYTGTDKAADGRQLDG